LAAHLIEHNLATAEELKGIEKEIDAEVADCVEFALSAPEPKPEELTRYIWAED
jgi:pyruvate dehydrogenase E1 component alpha subunit